jgi:hypothetical protein
VSDQRFIGETEARLRVVLRRKRHAVVSCEEKSCKSTSVKWTLCVLSCSGIGSVRFRETCIIPVLRSVARRRLVGTGNPSACATVNCKVCK